MSVAGHGGVVVAGLLGILGVRHAGGAVRSAVLAGDCGLQVAFGGTLGGGAHGLGELRVGGHGAVKQNLAAWSRRGGAGLAEAGGLGALHGLRHAGLGCLGRGGFAGLVGFAFLDGGLERAQSNLGGTQVGDLVNLEQRVHVRLVGQNLGHLISGDGVEAATEGIELHKLEARIQGHEVCGRVQAGVVGPLVSDAQRHLGDRAVSHVAESGGVLGTRIGLALGKEFGEVELLPRLQFADGILGEYHHAERADGFGDAVVDFGVDVVGTAGEHDASAVVLFHIGKRGQTFLLHVMLEDLVFGIGGLDRGFGLFAGHVGPRKLFDDAVNHELMVGKVEVRVHVTHVILAQLRHVGADDERIVGHDRAVVVVVRVGHEVLLVAHARVEDGLDALVEQPLDMAVHQLGRVADVFGGDGFDAGLEQLVGAAAGDHHLEAQRGEQREPERVVLVHVEGARDADFATGGGLVGKSAVGEATLVLVVVQVRAVGALLLGVAAAFAAVAGHEARAVGERGDGELAVVLAQLAHVTLGGHAHVVERFAGQDGAGGVGHAVHDNDMDLRLGRLGLLEGCGLGLGLGCGLSLGLFLGPIGLNHHIQVVGLILIVHAGGQGGAERAHKAGDVRAGDLTFGEQLEGAQHGVVEERTALDHHSVAEFAGIAQLDDLVQGVAHHGVAQAGSDVLDGGAFLLRLLDRGVHEHGATRTEVHRMGGSQSLLREFLNRQAHGHGEGLQERTTAGRAGLVDGD